MHAQQFILRIYLWKASTIAARQLQPQLVFPNLPRITIILLWYYQIRTPHRRSGFCISVYVIQGKYEQGRPVHYLSQYLP